MHCLLSKSRLLEALTSAIGKMERRRPCMAGYWVVVGILLVLSGDHDGGVVHGQTQTQTQAQGLDLGLVRVGAFNMRVFGQTKVQDMAAIDKIAKIVLRYDLVLLQEIRDVSGTAIYTFLNVVNWLTDDPYILSISPRLGRTNSKEQYAYLYRGSKLRLEMAYVYSDPGDRFEREPYIGFFSSELTAVSRLVMVGIHTRPTDAWTEIDLLVNVHQDIKDRFEVENVVFAGDFNADCSYVPNYRWEEVRLRTETGYKWLIGDDEDTTVSSTNCAYDRIVIAGSDLQSAIVPCSANVFKFDDEYGLSQDQALAVSDHYPVEFTFLPRELASRESSLIIAAFNVQLFGRTKAAKDDVMAVLATIVKRYDLILIQEIRDISGTAIEKLLEWSNRDNPDPFSMVVSDRLGRTSSKEQYAYIYRPSKLVLEMSEVYVETNGDVFQREPFIAHFRSPTTELEEFIIVGIHTMPDEAVTEIDGLVDVYSAIQQKYGIEDVILTGDFNADCDYVSSRRWPDIRLRTDPQFCWLIEDDADTTVKSTDCAYDRFVISGRGLLYGILPYTATTFRFDLAYNLNVTQAAAISDHYPVELQLSKRRDETIGTSVVVTRGSRADCTVACRNYLSLACVLTCLLNLTDGGQL